MLVSIALALAVQAAPPEPHYLRISFNPRGDATMLRSAAPSGTFEPWFKPQGAAFKAMAALPAGTALYANGTFTVDAEGKVGDCVGGARYEKTAEAIALGEAICADLRANGRFVPALDASGRRAASTMALFGKASDKSGLWGEGADNPPLVDKMPLPPAPPAPPGMWMTSYDMGSYAVSGARLYIGERRLITAGAVTFTGVRLSLDPSGKTLCLIGKSSGDPRNDARACKVAGKYKLGALTPPRYNSGAMVMVVHGGGKPSALLPIRKRGVGPRLTAAGATRIAAIIGKPVDDAALAKRLSASVGRDGIATRCTIETGEGNDVADVALCRALKSEALFTPAEDVFGLPSDGWL